jgi:hypothetical protein
MVREKVRENAWKNTWDERGCVVMRDGQPYSQGFEKAG